MATNETYIILPDPNSINLSEEFSCKSIQSLENSKYGSELLDVLCQVGAVSFNCENKLALSNFFLNHPNYNNASRLLGYVAEGIIVRECNQNLAKNRIWANYARRLKKASNQFIGFFYIISLFCHSRQKRNKSSPNN